MQNNLVGLVLLPRVDNPTESPGRGERGVCVETQSDLEINSPVGNFVF